MDTIQINSLIDRLCNKLWAAGLTNPVTYIEQINYLFFLKMLEEWDTEKQREARLSGGQHTHKSIFDGKSEKYRWSEWSQIPDTTRLFRFVRDEAFPFMAELPGTRAEVRRFFQGAQLQIPDGATLRDVIDLFRDINFIELDADVKGDLYEHLLSQLSTSGRAGQFRTPRHIIRMIVQLVDPKIGETILDPAFGTGGFLIGAYEWIKLQNSDPANVAERPSGNGQTIKRGYGDKLNKTQWDFLRTQAFYGFDVDAHIHKIGTMNLILHGLEQSTILRRDAIAGSPDDWEDRQFDVILSNPPFSGSINKERIRKTLPVISPKTEILFIGLMIDALRDNGRCGVVVPEGLLSGQTSAYKEVRRLLLERCDLEGVVSLPGGIFEPYSNSKTSILIFKKGKPTHSVWFYQVAADGFSLDKKRLPIPERTDIPDLLTKWPVREESSKSWKVGIAIIQRAGYDLTATRYKPYDTIPEPTFDLPERFLQAAMSLQQTLRATVEEIDSQLPECNRLCSYASWHQLTLAQACIVNPKKDELKSTGRQLPVSFVPMSAIDEHKGMIVTSEQRPLAEVEKGFTYFREGDVLFAKITPCMENGKAAIAKGLANGIGFGSTEFHVLRPRDGVVLPEWIYYVVRSKSFRSKARARMTGSAGQQRVPTSFLEEELIPIPPIEDQRRIVRILDCISTTIKMHSDCQNLLERALESTFSGILERRAGSSASPIRDTV